VCSAYLTRASSGDIDNTPVIERILELRQQKAKLLGYANFAEVSMASKVGLSSRKHILPRHTVRGAQPRRKAQARQGDEMRELDQRL
jgi:Zn-dependent oligopeptidase